MARSLEQLDGTLARLAERLVLLEEERDRLRRRLDILEAWATAPSAPFADAGGRLARMEAQLELALRRQKGDPGERGPRGFEGPKGRDGNDGEAAATVIREVKISG